MGCSCHSVPFECLCNIGQVLIIITNLMKVDICLYVNAFYCDFVLESTCNPQRLKLLNATLMNNLFRHAVFALIFKLA